MNRDRTYIALAIGLFGLAAISGPKIARAAEFPVVEVGVPNDGVYGLGGQYILDKGLDRKNGYIMKPRWAGVADVERLLAIGAIAVGTTTSESALRANLNSIPIRFVTPYMEPHHQFLVRKESPYKTVEELKGKSVALTSEVTSLYNMFDFIMRKKGYNIEKEFNLKKLGAAGIIAVLEKGEVEGAIVWEAHVSKLLATGKYKVIMFTRDEMKKTLNTKVKILGWIGALEPWVKANPEMVAKVRASWAETWRGVQKDEAHFRKHAKNFFGLETPEAVTLGWQRTSQFLLPADFVWPDGPTLQAEKVYLREGIQMGIFAKEANQVIDALFVP